MLVSLWLLGCWNDVDQIAGTGAVYTTRCSAQMEARGPEWFARCEPPKCADRFVSAAVGHVVVSVDAAGGVAGFAERTCLQDLSDANGRFQPPLEPTSTAPRVPEPVPAPEAPK